MHGWYLEDLDGTHYPKLSEEIEREKNSEWIIQIEPLKLRISHNKKKSRLLLDLLILILSM